MGIRAEQKEKRRQEILDAALDLFIHKGFSATSVRDIAGVIHASPALLFHYFESKDDILMELLSIAMGGVDAATGMLDDKVPPLARFENIARMIFESFTNYSQSAPLFLLMHQIVVFDSIPAKAKAIAAQNTAMVSSIPIILEGQRAGSIREGDPTLLAMTFWAAIQGVAETVAMCPSCPTPNPVWISDILKK